MNTLFEALPGSDLIAQGLDDLAAGRKTCHGLLVLIGRPRLERLGLPEFTHNGTPSETPHLQLYELLALAHGDEAHSQYNALIRRLVSFERALEQRLRTLNKPGDRP